jgi:hypothetical protein
MSLDPLPLAEASKRLRKPAGRPPKPRAVAEQASGHPAGPPLTRVPELTVAVLWPLSPRLLSLPDAGRYLGVSTWTIRDYFAAGLLTRIKLPAACGGDLDRVLVDRLELDALIVRSGGAWKPTRKPEQAHG